MICVVTIILHLKEYVVLLF